MAIKTVLDKPSQTVIRRKPSIFFFRRQRVIPFSNVSNVAIDYDPEVAGTSGVEIWRDDAWKVSLVTGRKKFEIAHTMNKADMLHLANEISKFIEKELVDNSAKP